MSEINGTGAPMTDQLTDHDDHRDHRGHRDHFTKRQTLLVAASTVVAAALGVGCVFAVQDAFAARGASSAQQEYSGQPAAGLHGGYGYGYGGSTGGYGSSGGTSGQSGSSDANPFDGNAYGGSGSGSSSGSGATGSPTTAATSAQSRGIVLIETQLGYQNAEAAGTGIVLTSSGEILTNNHVIEGSTSITVIDAGKSYTAKVVGDDATDDIAVLQLQGAKGLATASLDKNHTVATGDAVTGVGNAEGGGTLVAAAGTVTGLDKSITTEAEQSAASESLTGLIETNAAIEPGDSGGPLFDAANKVIGIDTAASSGGVADGYAIPIATALDIAKKITSGDEGGSIELGYPAFLGIELGETDASGYGAFAGDGSTATAQGAAIAGVVSNGPAEEAGLAAGDVITAVDGKAVASADALQSALKSSAPGDEVSLTWVDSAGQSHTASVTLTEGPAA
ncbi:S1C family serine protease [Gryllotalpicola daejeonensis]